MRTVVSDGSSVLCSLGEQCWHRQYWLWWWSYNQMIVQGAVQYSVHCTIFCSRKPGGMLKAVTCPGLSHVSMPGFRACTSKSGSGLHHVLSFKNTFQFYAVWNASILLSPNSYWILISLNFSLHGSLILSYMAVLSQVDNMILTPDGPST